MAVLCWVCGSHCLSGRVTCKEQCHEMLVDKLEREFGTYKKVTDQETGKTYTVPTRDLIEKGLRQQDLKTYPEARAGE